MKVERTICDTCKKPFTAQDYRADAQVQISFNDFNAATQTAERLENSWDFCEVCLARLHRFLRHDLPVTTKKIRSGKSVIL
jgi:NMD protein affecting ribosome stability and mRNA decay